MEYTAEIAHNDSLFLGKHFDRSNGKAPGFPSPYIVGMDSIQIVYNNMYVITHVWNIPDSLLLPHQLDYKNERNVGRAYNYNWWFVEATRNLYHEFTFIPEDYEYAREFGHEIE